MKSIDELEQMQAQYEKRRDEEALPMANQVQQLENVIKDLCEMDTQVRELARLILGDFAVDGDRYGVPALGDIVEALIAKLTSAEKELSVLRQQLSGKV